jgi:outer membrane protein insertion porin family
MRGVKYCILALIAVFAIQFAVFPKAFAEVEQQDAQVVQEEGIIKSIKIKGGQRTEDSTVVSYSELGIGQKYTKSKENEALKNLYNTGFFSNVAIDFNNGQVTISIEENPIVNMISIKGNKVLKTENIMPEISLKPRGYFSKSKVQSDVARIFELYSKLGTFSVTIDPKISKLPQNRVDVLFNITEGSKVKIEKISFIGNKKFSSNDLKQVMVSKENRIFNFFRLNHYSPDAVEYDKVMLSKFYNSRGYADFKVLSVNAEVVPTNMERLYITFVVDEGVRYNFNKMDIVNKIPSIKQEDLLKLVNIKSGSVFNGSLVEDVNSKIIKYLAEKGFPFVKVDYEYELHKETRLIDVQFKILEAPKVYIGKINISGNTKTHDYVIRREFRLSEGDPYNGFLIDRSKQRVENLDFFKKVELTPTRTSSSDVVDLKVDVQEKSTATVKLSAGYSSSNGPLAAINFSEINWLGCGQKLSAGLEKSAFTTGASFGYSEPHFMGSEVEVGGSVGYSNQKNDSKGSLAKLASDHTHIPFNDKSYYVSAFMNYDITEYLNHNVDYTVTIQQVSAAYKNTKVPLILREELGKSLTSAVGHTLTYNVANSAIKPTDGYIISLNQSIAGLGGDIKYFKQILKAAYYYPITDDLTFKIAGDAGHIHKIDKNKSIRINDNFYLGEFSFRGFDSAGIGPRDKGAAQKALGGLSYYKVSTELLFPFPGVSRDMDLSTSIFCDLGSLWDIDIPKKIKGEYTKADYHNRKSIRAAAGVGFIWITRAGPIRIDFAKAFKKEKFDETKTLLFSYQTAL